MKVDGTARYRVFPAIVNLTHVYLNKEKLNISPLVVVWWSCSYTLNLSHAIEPFSSFWKCLSMNASWLSPCWCLAACSSDPFFISLKALHAQKVPRPATQDKYDGKALQQTQNVLPPLNWYSRPDRESESATALLLHFWVSEMRQLIGAECIKSCQLTSQHGVWWSCDDWNEPQSTALFRLFSQLCHLLCKPNWTPLCLYLTLSSFLISPVEKHMPRLAHLRP